MAGPEDAAAEQHFTPPEDKLANVREAVARGLFKHEQAITLAEDAKLPPELRVGFRMRIWDALAEEVREYWRGKADVALDLVFDEMGGEIDKVKIVLVELNKKLDDREADLIEAKREEREQIGAEVRHLVNCYAKNEAAEHDKYTHIS